MKYPETEKGAFGKTGSKQLKRKCQHIVIGKSSRSSLKSIHFITEPELLLKLEKNKTSNIDSIFLSHHANQQEHHISLKLIED